MAVRLREERREASEIERGRREASERGQRVDRGELYMYKREKLIAYTKKCPGV